MFTDRVKLHLKAGKGGDGVVAWRKEKYIPKGGPYGGDGGKGGSVILEADNQIPSLEAYRNQYLLKAEDGQQGRSNCCTGRNGKDLILKVPCGTLVKDAETQEVLFDFTQDKERWLICQGGKGGKGNNHFKTPTNRAPNICTKGRLGHECDIELELKLIADVGLVGFPNAGKSTFITKTTKVSVKIAPYPFTTLRPNLGYLFADGGQRVLLADIPGIIEGAHLDKGLGLEFLRHIERTHLLLFVLDVSGFELRDPVKDFQVLRNEIGAYNPELLEKPFLVALNKCDIEGAEENCKIFRESYPFDPNTIFEISALSGHGIAALVERLKRELSK